MQDDEAGTDGRYAEVRGTEAIGADGREAVRVFLRPVASPLPMGFVGLAGGTIALTAQQLGWVPAAQSHLVAVAVLLMAVPLQATGSLVGYLGRDPVAATGMATLAVSWAVIGVLTLYSPPGGRSPVLGFVLFYLAAAVLVSAVVAAVGKGLVALVLGLAAARFALTGVYEYLGGSGWMHAAGWVGLALCVLALYSALALELEGIRHSTVLPTLRYGSARTAVSGDGLPTIGAVQREAGVREQL